MSFEPQLARAVRKAAGSQPTSAWLADAAERKLRAEGLLAAIESWEATHGALTPAELRAARVKLRGSKRS